jgi:branched-subunit amino acid aminotransferase/4-amino-4-deoxychorismate lyase
VAANNKMISISLRKRLKPKLNFSLKLIDYKRIEPEYKNLKYKKILNFLKKMDTTKSDIALYKNKKILESGTSNLLFVKKNKIYSPINNFYKGTTLKFFTKKLKKIKKRNIFIDSLESYDEIIIIGSGKGVVSVNSIEKPFWKRKSLKNYRILSKIYQQAVTNCPRYNG